MNQEFIYLASASPRRCTLLDQIGVPFRVRPAEIDESRRRDETPVDFVKRLALSKADAVWRAAGRSDARAVLAADTAVVMNRQVLGKPVDRDDALAMLARLSGRTHEVLTAVACVCRESRDTRVSSSRVSFRATTAREREAYWETGEPADKAGGYAVQGRGAVFISRLEGSYSGVMGLPLFETAALLQSAGVTPLA